MKVLKTLGGLVSMMAGPELTAGHRQSWFTLADRFHALTHENRILRQSVKDRLEERDFFIREFFQMADVFVNAKKTILTDLKTRTVVDVKAIHSIDDDIVKMEMLIGLGRQMLSGQEPPVMIQ